MTLHRYGKAHRCALVPMCAVVPFLAQPAAAQKEAAPPATEPAARTSEQWVQRHEAINERAKQGDVDLVFLGDSITQGWETAGKDIWEEYYGKRNAMNMGISGDQTGHVLWRLEHGNVEGISPEVVVLMIGTNNMGVHSAEQIAEGIRAIVQQLRDRLPDTKILLLGIFPRGQEPGEIREKIRDTNQKASEVADGDMVHYLDIGDRFVRPGEELSREVMPDYLHLSPKGYRIWAEAIEPKLVELMKSTVSDKEQADEGDGD